MKATGAEIQDFYDNGWPEGYYIDDFELEVYEDDGSETGKFALDLTTKYDLSQFGSLYPNDPPYEDKPYDHAISFEAAFKKWKKVDDTVSIVLRVSKSLEADLRAMLDAQLKGSGWTGVRVLK